MHTRRVLVNAILLISLLFGMVPVIEVRAEESVGHSFDDAALLMFSSQMRLDGEVQSAMIPGGHLMKIPEQASSWNEVDILIKLYANQIAKLRADDLYTPDREADLVDELESRISSLQKKSQAVNNRRRGGGGLFDVIKRGVKSLGRFTGRVVGGLMEGAGKVVGFAIEEVAPKVLKEALMNGAPINAALVRKVVRELLLHRAEIALERKLEARDRWLAAMEGGEVDAADVAGLQEAFEEDDQGPAPPDAGGDTSNPAPEQDPIPAAGSSPCGEVEVLGDVMHDSSLTPDILVRANTEVTAAPSGYSIIYPGLPETATMSDTARVMVNEGAVITATSAAPVSCVGVLLVGDLMTPASIYLDDTFVWGGYLYPIQQEPPRPFRTYFVRFAVEPARPVTISIIADPTGNEQLGVWVPVEGFGFYYP